MWAPRDALCLWEVWQDLIGVFPHVYPGRQLVLQFSPHLGWKCNFLFPFQLLLMIFGTFKTYVSQEMWLELVHRPTILGEVGRRDEANSYLANAWKWSILKYCCKILDWTFPDSPSTWRWRLLPASSRRACSENSKIFPDALICCFQPGNTMEEDHMYWPDMQVM